MKMVVTYESMFGCTHQVAEAICEGLREGAPDAQVDCVPVAAATSEVLDADLLVVGGPTHMLHATSPRSRAMGLKGEASKPGFHPEPDAAGPGVRELLDRLPHGRAGAVAAAFDTRLPSRLAGGASRSIEHGLRRHGWVLAVPREGFLVEGTEGPLKAGEVERARAWGATLARTAMPVG